MLNLQKRLFGGAPGAAPAPGSSDSAAAPVPGAAFAAPPAHAHAASSASVGAPVTAPAATSSAASLLSRLRPLSFGLGGATPAGSSAQAAVSPAFSSTSAGGFVAPPAAAAAAPSSSTASATSKLLNRILSPPLVGGGGAGSGGSGSASAPTTLAAAPSSAASVPNAVSAALAELTKSTSGPSAGVVAPPAGCPPWDALTRQLAELAVFHGQLHALRASLVASEAACGGVGGSLTSLADALDPLGLTVAQPVQAAGTHHRGGTNASSASSWSAFFAPVTGSGAGATAAAGSASAPAPSAGSASVDALGAVASALSSRLHPALTTALSAALVRPIDGMLATHDRTAARARVLAAAQREYGAATRELAQLQRKAAAVGTAATAAAAAAHAHGGGSTVASLVSRLHSSGSGGGNSGASADTAVGAQPSHLTTDATPAIDAASDATGVADGTPAQSPDSSDDGDEVASVVSGGGGGEHGNAGQHAQQHTSGSGGHHPHAPSSSSTAAPPPDTRQGRLMARLTSAHAVVGSHYAALATDLAALGSQRARVSGSLKDAASAIHLAYLQAVGAAAAEAAGAPAAAAADGTEGAAADAQVSQNALQRHLGALQALADTAAASPLVYGAAADGDGRAAIQRSASFASQHHGDGVSAAADALVDASFAGGGGGGGVRRAVPLDAYRDYRKEDAVDGGSAGEHTAARTVLSSTAWLAHIVGSYLSAGDAATAGGVCRSWAAAVTGRSIGGGSGSTNSGDGAELALPVPPPEAAVETSRALWLTLVRSGGIVVHARATGAVAAAGHAAIDDAATARLRARFWSRALGIDATGLPLPVWSAGHALAAAAAPSGGASAAVRYWGLAPPTAVDVLALLRVALAESAAGGKGDGQDEAAAGDVDGGDDDGSSPPPPDGGDGSAGPDSAALSDPTALTGAVPTCRWAVMIEQDVLRSYPPGLAVGDSAAVDRARTRIARRAQWAAEDAAAAAAGDDDGGSAPADTAAVIPKPPLPWWPLSAAAVLASASNGVAGGALPSYPHLVLWPYQHRLRGRGRRAASAVSSTLTPAARAAVAAVEAAERSLAAGSEPTAAGGAAPSPAISADDNDEGVAYELGTDGLAAFSLQDFIEAGEESGGALEAAAAAYLAAGEAEAVAPAVAAPVAVPAPVPAPAPEHRPVVALPPRPRASTLPGRVRSLAQPAAATTPAATEPPTELPPPPPPAAADVTTSTLLPARLLRRRRELRTLLLALAACEPAVRYTQGMSSVGRLLLEAAVAGCSCDGDGDGECDDEGAPSWRCRCDSAAPLLAPQRGGHHAQHAYIPRHVVVAFGWFRALLRWGTATPSSAVPTTAASDGAAALSALPLPPPSRRLGMVPDGSSGYPLAPPPLGGGLACLYVHDLTALRLRLYQLDRLLLRRLPGLHAHLAREGLPSPAAYASQWVLTLFSSFTALDAPGCGRLLDALLVGGWPAALTALVAVMGALAPLLASAPMEDALAMLAAPRAYYPLAAAAALTTSAEGEGEGDDGVAVATPFCYLRLVQEADTGSATTAGGAHITSCPRHGCALAGCAASAGVGHAELDELEGDFLSYRVNGGGGSGAGGGAAAGGGGGL